MRVKIAGASSARGSVKLAMFICVFHTPQGRRLAQTGIPPVTGDSADACWPKWETA